MGEGEDKMEKLINEILKKNGEKSVNLLSESCRKKITSEIMDIVKTHTKRNIKHITTYK